MKAFLILLIIVLAWSCQAGLGQQQGAESLLEEQLLELYYFQESAPVLAARDSAAGALQEIRKAELPSALTFELWYQLQQLMGNSTTTLPYSTDSLLKVGLQAYLPEEQIRLLQRAAATRYFRDQYLYQVLSSPEQAPPSLGLNDAGPLWLELSHYELSEADAIAEIGAGDGGFSLLLHLRYHCRTHFINELDSLALTRVTQLLELLPDAPHPPIPVQGTIYSTGLEDHLLDAVILRNTLHHFAAAEDMLQSIRRSLAADGVLYVMEEVDNAENGQPHCSQALSEDELLTVMQMEGFALQRAHSIGGNWRRLYVFGTTSGRMNN